MCFLFQEEPEEEMFLHTEICTVTKQKTRTHIQSKLKQLYEKETMLIFIFFLSMFLSGYQNNKVAKM